ncbi:hypothetical protein [Photobacterium damselae]|uniref:hypothetical protein n=1 Tax=Photobacterium damselae TaxID=38293 RepID=UPI00406828D1
MLVEVWSSVKRKLQMKIVSNRYDLLIRSGVLIACGSVFCSMRGETITLKHFDEESGVDCLLSGDAISPSLVCKNDNLIGVGLDKISPVEKIWHYRMKGSSVDIARVGYSKGIEFVATGSMFKGEKTYKMPYRD